MDYFSMDTAALAAEKQKLQQAYDDFAKQGLKLDMTRGKPSAQQLDLSNGLFSLASYVDEDGVDARNYGALEGLGEARRFFAGLLGITPEETLVGGNSSLSMMYNMIDLGWRVGFVPGTKPWKDCANIKFLCPAPGYDRHFRITESFGFELLSVPMTPNGPDMDVVEKLCQDDSVKGIWCVPIYSNPEGYTYSAETVQRLASMKTAPDFRIIWDNSYGFHHLADEHESCPNLLAECRKAGNEDRALMFCSTSKITFAGAGVAAMGASKNNIAAAVAYYTPMTICFDKVNQLRTVRFLQQEGGVAAHMEKHRAILAPKFQLVLDAFQQELRPCGAIARWTEPKGGYFISLFVMDGCAADIIERCKKAGVTLTGVGAAFPYGKDPANSLIRIAPSFPTPEELAKATELLCIVTRLVCLEKISQ